MIRTTLIILGLTTGFTAVLLAEGRMTHLRQFVPGLEPVWARDFSNASGVITGENDGMTLAVFPAPTPLRWRFDHLGKAGPVWRMNLSGTGIEAQGKLRLSPGLKEARLSVGKGAIALDKLPQITAGLRLGGDVVIDAMRAEFSYSGDQINALRGQAQWLNARVDGQEIGTGEISLVSGDSGGWRAPFELHGEVVQITGQIEGRFGVALATLEITIEDAGAMPDSWKRALGQQVQRGDKGWTIRREVNLTGGWPIF